MQKIIASSEKILLLREKRKAIRETIEREEIAVNKLVKDNLDLFDYIINVDHMSICEANILETKFRLLVEERIKDICEETYKQILLIYEKLIIPDKISLPFPEQNKKDMLVSLEDYLKFLFCVHLFEEKLNIKSDTCIHFNLISLECVFSSQNEILSKINPVNITWNIDTSLLELFKKNITINFNTENLNTFIMKKKLDLFLKYLKKYMSFPKEGLFYLNSYLLPKNFATINLIHEKDTNLSESDKIINDFFSEVNVILLQSNIDEESKALIYSYMILINKGITSFADTSYFKDKGTYYYVKWIDVFKNEVYY